MVVSVDMPTANIIAGVNTRYLQVGWGAVGCSGVVGWSGLVHEEDGAEVGRNAEQHRARVDSVTSRRSLTEVFDGQLQLPEHFL